jgi:maltooligosyltrehalose trehalohydrolase
MGQDRPIHPQASKLASVSVEKARRRLPISAEVCRGGVSFRLWAPARERAFVLIGNEAEHELVSEQNGYFP